MRDFCLFAAVVLVGCGGVDVPRSEQQSSGGLGGAANGAAGSGGAGSGNSLAGAGAGGTNVVTLPSGPIQPPAGVSPPEDTAGTGGAGYEPTVRTTGACILERISSREAAGGEGGSAGASDSATAGADAASGTEAAGGAAADGIELGQGDLTLLVVFDKSGSMDGLWDERTKWQVANESLMKAIDPVIDNLTLGTIFFPQPAGGCDVVPLSDEQQIGFRTGRDFRSYWQETQAERKPDGSTPLERSLKMADLAIEEGCHLGLLNDRFRVVLVTDGEPTCGDDPTAIVELVADWNRAGVETWVMGLPGSDPAKTLLDAIALAGSTGESQSLATPGALDDGLAAAAR
jgi:hypothetical protein